MFSSHFGIVQRLVVILSTKMVGVQIVGCAMSYEQALMDVQMYLFIYLFICAAYGI